MSNPESGPTPYQETEVVSPIDQALEDYGQVMSDIETNGPSEERSLRQAALEAQLQDLRLQSQQIEETLGDAHRQGRAFGDFREATKKYFNRASQEGQAAAAAYRKEVGRQSTKYRAPSPVEANEAVIAEATENAQGTDVPEITETDPVELSKTIADSHGKLVELLYEMEDEVMKNHVDLQAEPNQFTKDEQDILRIVDSTRASYDNFVKTRLKPYPGTDFEIPESLTSISVDDMRDIAFVIAQRHSIVKHFFDDYLREHPHREGAE